MEGTGWSLGLGKSAYNHNRAERFLPPAPSLPPTGLVWPRLWVQLRTTASLIIKPDRLRLAPPPEIAGLGSQGQVGVGSWAS